MKILQITAQERIAMKSRKKDNAKHKKHPVKVTIQDDIRRMVKTQDFEAEVTGENISRIVQE